MTEISRLFDLHKYDSIALAEVLADFTQDGIVRDAENELVVVPGSGLDVVVRTGRALINGYWYRNSTNISVPLQPNTTGATRADRVVIRLDKATRTIGLYVKTGLSGTPEAVSRNNAYWEITVAIVDVPNGASTISSGDIRDLRNSVEYGGNVYGGRVSPQSFARVALNVALATDLVVSCAGGTWTNFWSAHSFTLNWDNSLVIVSVNGAMIMSQSPTGVRWTVDGSVAMRGGIGFTGEVNPLSGAGGLYFLKGYLKGSHTLQTQLYPNALGNVSCFASSAPLSHGFRLQVLEFPDMKVN